MTILVLFAKHKNILSWPKTSYKEKLEEKMLKINEQTIFNNKY